MELSFKELKKREVVNVADGSSFGHITDVELAFPEGKLTAIIVPMKKSGGIFGLFSRGKMRVDRRSVIKIGGDAILVNVKCGDACASSVSLNPLCPPPPRPPNPLCSPCPPPPCPEPKFSDETNSYSAERIDGSDY